MHRNLQAFPAALVSVFVVGTSSMWGQASSTTPIQLPPPTGDYRVGTTLIHLTDSGPRGEHRRLAVQLWYPADSESRGPLAPYVLELAELRAALPPEVATRYASVRTNAMLEVPVSTERTAFPVVIFSHGLGMNRYEYSTLNEELASHGFIVAGIDHPGGAAVTLSPDGGFTTPDPRWDEMIPPEYSIEERFRFADGQTEVWARDAGLVLDRLPAAAPAILAGHLDHGRVGAFGHSVGGKAAAVLCMLDERIDACADLDGWPLHAHIEVNGLRQPFIFVEDLRDVSAEELEAWGATLDEYARNMVNLRERKDRLLGRMQSESYHVVLRGIRHLYFSDVPYMDSSAMDPAALLSPREALGLIRGYVTAFFVEQLLGQETDLLSPRATVRVHGAQQYLNDQPN